MRAYVVRELGGPDVFSEVELPDPEAGPGQVVIDVRATSVNPIDVKLRSRALPFARPLPAVLHGDVAGVVRSVGAGVTRFAVGDEVYGCAGGVRGTASGALAEQMLADERLLAHKPTKLGFGDAAALPLVALTSWEVLVDRLDVRAGQSLLVHGGAGGVGHIAVQLGVWLGADVFATVSERDMAKVEGWGATPIDRRATSVDAYVATHTGGKGFDAVFDTVGGENLGKSFTASKYLGAIACIATGGTHDLLPMYVKGITLHSVLMLIPMLTGEGRAHHGEILTTIARLVDRGRIRPLVDEQRFGFAEIGRAHARLESGEARGKIVVER